MGRATATDWRERGAALRPRAEAFIDGAFVPAAAGETFEDVTPRDGSVIAAVARCRAEDVDRAVAAARRAFAAGAWSTASPRRRRRVLRRLAELMSRAPRGARPDRGARRRQADRRRAAHRRAHRHRLHRVVRRRDRQGLRRGRADRRRRGGHDHARAARGGRRGRPVELPADPDRLEARAGAGHRQQRRAQARRAVPAVRPAARASWPPRPGSPTACSTSCRASGPRPARAARPPPGRRQDRLHRLGGHRPALPRLRGGVQRQGGQPRAGRQEPAGRARRRARPRGRRAGRRLGRLLQRRADLPRRHAAGGRALRARAAGRAARRAGRRLRAGRPARPGEPDRRARLARSSGDGVAAVDARVADGASCGHRRRPGGAIVGRRHLRRPDDARGRRPGLAAVAREEVFGPVLASAGRASRGGCGAARQRLARTGWPPVDLDARPRRAHRVRRALRAGTVWVNTVRRVRADHAVRRLRGQSGGGRDLSLHALEQYTDLKTTWIAL